MLKNLVNLKGVMELNKKQQKSLKGGLGPSSTIGSGATQLCILTYNGQRHNFYTNHDPDQAAASNAANAECVRLIGNGTTSNCHYDCGHDGFGG